MLWDLTQSSCATTSCKPRCRKFRFPRWTIFRPPRKCAANGGRAFRNCPGPRCRQMENSDIMREASRAVATMSPSLDPTIGIVVCVPCFRRPEQLRTTLQSLVDQRTYRRLAVVMVENEASTCGSVPVAHEFLRSGRLRGLCVVEPRQGNCQAI